MGKNTGKIREICQSENVGTMVKLLAFCQCTHFRWSTWKQHTPPLLLPTHGSHMNWKTEKLGKHFPVREF